MVDSAPVLADAEAAEADRDVVIATAYADGYSQALEDCKNADTAKLVGDNLSLQSAVAIQKALVRYYKQSWEQEQGRYAELCEELKAARRPSPGDAEITPASDALGNLLAVIFRDGGHRQTEIGNDKVAGLEAERIVVELRSEVERQAALLRATPQPAGPAPGWRYPEELTPELDDALGFMCFQVISIVEAFRRAGHKIEHRAEREQAFALHWFVKLALQHGVKWREVAQDELKRMRAAAAPAPPATKEGGQ